MSKELNESIRDVVGESKREDEADDLEEQRDERGLGSERRGETGLSSWDGKWVKDGVVVGGGRSRSKETCRGGVARFVCSGCVQAAGSQTDCGGDVDCGLAERLAGAECRRFERCFGASTRCGTVGLSDGRRANTKTVERLYNLC